MAVDPPEVNMEVDPPGSEHGSGLLPRSEHGSGPPPQQWMQKRWWKRTS